METKRPTLVGLGGVLAAVALVAAACGSSAAVATGTAVPATSAPAGATESAAGATEPAAMAEAVTIAGFAFSPAAITVKPGTMVTWTNKDSVGHSVVADDGSWASGILSQGQTFSHTFDAAGTYAYHCGVHPSMTGTVIVAP